MFIPTYAFMVDVSKVSLINFISNVPPDLYFFLVPPQSTLIYGYFVSEDLMEYFLNEIPVKNFQIITIEELRQVMKKDQFTIWGNKDLALLQ